jgi:hypothetical protein
VALTKELREENLHDTSWKDDVLQLTAQLYYVWCSLQQHLEDSYMEYQVVSQQPTESGMGLQERERDA